MQHSINKSKGTANVETQTQQNITLIRTLAMYSDNIQVRETINTPLVSHYIEVIITSHDDIVVNYYNPSCDLSMRYCVESILSFIREE